MKQPKNMTVQAFDTASEIHWQWTPLFAEPRSRLRLGCGLVWLYGTLAMLLLLALGLDSAVLAVVAAGLLLLALYFQLARAVNRTIIRIDRQAIQIRHVPLPYPGSRRIPLAELSSEKLVVRQQQPGRPRGGGSYSVQAARKVGEPAILFKAIPDRDHAQFIASQINRFRTEFDT